MGRNYQKTKINIIVFVMLFSLLGINIYGQVPEWFSKLTKITPLVATKAEVERLFPKLKTVKINYFVESRTFYYQSGKDYFSISYSNGKCSEKNQNGWDVPKDVVLRVYYSLNKNVSIKKLKLDLFGFSTYTGGDTEHIIYENRDKGISYATFKEKVSDIHFFISSQIINNLECSKRLPK